VADDPLLPFLERNLATLPSLLSELILPLRSLEPDDEVLQTVEFDYRYTWQEVERARRYVKPLDALPREQAKSSAIFQIHGYCFDAIMSDERVPRLNLEVTAEEMDARVASEQDIDIERRYMVMLPSGVAIYWVPNPAVIALPTSVVHRQVSWREALNAYQIRESVDIGRLQILRPDLLSTQGFVPDPEPDREPKRF
jgi:hypothetical protein